MFQQQNINDFTINLRNAYPFNEYRSLVHLYGLHRNTYTLLWYMLRVTFCMMSKTCLATFPCYC